MKIYKQLLILTIVLFLSGCITSVIKGDIGEENYGKRAVVISVLPTELTTVQESGNQIRTQKIMIPVYQMGDLVEDFVVQKINETGKLRAYKSTNPDHDWLDFKKIRFDVDEKDYKNVREKNRIVRARLIEIAEKENAEVVVVIESPWGFHDGSGIYQREYWNKSPDSFSYVNLGLYIYEAENGFILQKKTVIDARKQPEEHFINLYTMEGFDEKIQPIITELVDMHYKNLGYLLFKSGLSDVEVEGPGFFPFNNKEESQTDAPKGQLLDSSQTHSL